jgi:hypothetical protein
MTETVEDVLRERVRKALAEYAGHLATKRDLTPYGDEREHLSVSYIQVQTARRILWLDSDV